MLGVVATQLGAFSIASGTIIIDTTRRSPSYEARILKYVSIVPALLWCAPLTHGGSHDASTGCLQSRRGFALIAPSLAGDLPADKFYLGRLRCSADAERFVFQLSPSSWNESALDETHDYGADAQHPLVNVYRNLNVASRNDAGTGLILLTGKTYEDLLERPVAIGFESVQKFFKQRAQHAFTWSHRPLLEVIQCWYGPDALDYVKVRLDRTVAPVSID